MPTSKPPAKKKAARMCAVKTKRGVLLRAFRMRCDAKDWLWGYRAWLSGATVVPVIVREVAPAKKRRGK